MPIFLIRHVRIGASDMKQILELGKYIWKRIDDVDVFSLAAQLAYFFLLSLFPFLIFLMSFIGYLQIDTDMIIEMLRYHAPSQIIELIETNITQLLEERNGGLLSIGIIGTLWAASNAVNAIIKAFNRAYEIEENRSFIVTRLIAVVMTIAMIVVIIVSLLLPIFGRIIGEFVFSIFGLSESFISVWETLRWALSTIIFFIVLLALYKLAPNTRIYLRDAVWGTIVGTVLWQIVAFGFSFYVTRIANYSVNYGSLGTVIVMMIWFYLFGLIIILGGVINAAVTKLRRDKRWK